jgi:hypothetical protein
MSGGLRAGDAAEAWIRQHVDPTGSIEVTHDRPWATVSRVPTAAGVVWFKACAPVQAFEPRLMVSLFSRWPDRVAEVLAYDEERSWLLLADAGTSIGTTDRSRETLLAILPSYAELQQGEAAYAQEHVDRAVPDLRLCELPRRYEQLLQHELPLERDEVACLRRFVDGFAKLCRELAQCGIAETIQHDDLHAANIHIQGERWRLLDWGDSSIAHPFMSLVVPYRFLEMANRPATDPWYERMRDAYLEPWGRGFKDAFALAIRIGAFAHAIAWIRQREALPEPARAAFNERFSSVLRRAVARTVE